MTTKTTLEKTELSHRLQRRQTREDGVVSLTTKKTDKRRRSCLIDYEEDRHEKSELSLTTKKIDTRRRRCLIEYKEDRHEKTELSH